MELIQYLTDLGYHGQADHLLHEAFPDGQGPAIAATAASMARRAGLGEEHKRWRSRSDRYQQDPLSDVPDDD
jgi:hypothetical protein